MMFLSDVCENQGLEQIVIVIRGVFTLIQIAIPVGLIIFGSIDLGKAVMAGEEKEIQAATKLLIKRAIAAVGVFIIVWVVVLVTGLVGGDDWQDCWRAAGKSTFKSDI